MDTPCVQLSLHKPSSPLEELLMRVAPQKEVMIGISNYNLILSGQLVSFLEVRRGGHSAHRIVSEHRW